METVDHINSFANESKWEIIKRLMPTTEIPSFEYKALLFIYLLLLLSTSDPSDNPLAILFWMIEKKIIDGRTTI